MMVIDLQHFLDLDAATPMPARRLAQQLGLLVQAATAGDAGVQWETALPCPRRPGNKRCPGRMIVLRTDAGGPIHWLCNGCQDQGQISNWEHTPFDLRRHGLTVAAKVNEIVIGYETAQALRDLQLLDPDCQRVVHRIRANNDNAVLAVSNDDLDELIGALSQEFQAEQLAALAGEER